MKLTTRHLFRGGKGLHARTANPRPTTPEPDAIWMACHSPRCGHMQTRHDEIREDLFRCRKCKRTTTGGA